MILIAFGANLPSRFGTPEQTLAAAQAALARRGVYIARFSSIWLTAPVPADPGQPWYRNAVAAIETALAPAELLRALKQTEHDFGRIDAARNAPRLLDLDILSYHDLAFTGPDLFIPHPRMHQRGFVLYPLREVAPGWVHPLMKKTADQLIEGLSPTQRECRVLERAA